MSFQIKYAGLRKKEKTQKEIKIQHTVHEVRSKKNS